MIGNVWEWTTAGCSTGHEADAPKACCVTENPRDCPEAANYDTCQPIIRIRRKVLKGGSHLCAPNYCRRYRPAARHAEATDTSTSHVGFRCVKRVILTKRRISRRPSRGVTMPRCPMGVTVNPQRPIAAATSALNLLPLSGYSGHGRGCCGLDPVANDPQRRCMTFDSEMPFAETSLSSVTLRAEAGVWVGISWAALRLFVMFYSVRFVC